MGRRRPACLRSLGKGTTSPGLLPGTTGLPAPLDDGEEPEITGCQPARGRHMQHIVETAQCPGLAMTAQASLVTPWQLDDGLNEQ